MSDSEEPMEPTKIRHGSAIGRRIYGFFGFKPAREQQASSDE